MGEFGHRERQYGGILLHKSGIDAAE